jgi:hypothetical protein
MSCIAGPITAYGPGMTIEQRLQVFRDHGLLAQTPTRWQLLQAEIEMTPYVISTDATDETAYRDHVLAHPIMRQAMIFSHVGLDHVRTGSALGARLESLCAHLILTYHQGMPVFDLQVVQTHPEGLTRLAAAIRETLDRSSSLGARRHRLVSRLLRDPRGYLERFLGPTGYIARAARFDYATADAAGSAFPPEFWSLVALADYAARTFPRDLPRRMPRHLARLATRRFREGGGFGWFG